MRVRLDTIEVRAMTLGALPRRSASARCGRRPPPRPTASEGLDDGPNLAQLSLFCQAIGGRTDLGGDRVQQNRA
jgi:hypothetical protein